MEPRTIYAIIERYGDEIIGRTLYESESSAKRALAEYGDMAEFYTISSYTLE